MVIGAFVLISALMGAFFSSKESVPSLPKDMVLYMPIEGAYPENTHGGFTAPFGKKPLTIREAVAALEAAATDDRVRGLIAEIKGGVPGVSQIQELRAALKTFREDGNKFAYIYAESYGEAGNGLAPYYLASAFDEIWMQPIGVLSLSGMRAEMPYMRDLLDKAGVTPAFFARKEYKNAFESFMERDMSAATEESMTALIDNMASRMVHDIALTRMVPVTHLKFEIDQGLLTGKEALVAGLIDRVDYADVLVAETHAEMTGDPDNTDIPFVRLADYALAHGHEKSLLAQAVKRPVVAVIYAQGMIVSRSEGGIGRDDVAAAEDISGYIDAAAEDERVKAIVLRINSPGGSPSASETIRRALVQAQKEKGKPVIVSMGGAAASGGYWIAAPADRIFALPATLTGSIGVTGGKFILSGLWDKVGVNWGTLQWGANAGMWSMNEPLTDRSRERFNALMDNTYDAFVARVAEGRHMTPAAVEEIARGRVWSGAQALERGLVDELGGLSEALDYAAAVVGVPDQKALNVVVMPKPLTPVEELMSLLEGQVTMGQSLQTYMRQVSWLEPFLSRMDAATQTSSSGISAYEPVSVLPD